MSRRNSEAEQSQSHYKYEQNRANYVPIDNYANNQNSQRIFKKVSANNSRRSVYKNPDGVLSNYQTYFVPVTDYDATTTKIKQQSIHAHYSYSSNSLYPTYIQGQDKVNDGRNKVIYLKYPSNDLQFKESKYNNSHSNYLLKEQENFYEYDIVPPSQNYSYYVGSDNKSNYKDPAAQLPKMVYSSYVPEIDVKFANNPNFYYPYSSEPSISSHRSIDDIIDYSINKSNYTEEPEKITANKLHSQELLKRFPDILKRLSKQNLPNKTNKNRTYMSESVYGTPCDETPTKQYCTFNANTQTSNHALTTDNSANKMYAATILNNEYTQTEYNDVRNSRSKETQTLNCPAGNPLFGGFVNNLVKKGHFIYSFYLRTTVVRWLRRILIELAWSVYNCPSNCPMQDRIIFSYLNHIERKSSTESNECPITSSSPSRRSCKKRVKN